MILTYIISEGGWLILFCNCLYMSFKVVSKNNNISFISYHIYICVKQHFIQGRPVLLNLLLQSVARIL